MKVSAAGRAAITLREGKRNAAYLDTEGVPTIGVGHTGRMAPPLVHLGETITDAQIDAYLEADLAPVEKALNAALDVPVSQNEFDALASLFFNVGTGYAKKTDVIIKNLNLGNVAAAAAGFDQFHIPASIISRRNGEKAQFLEPDAVATAQRGQVLVAKSAAATKSANVHAGAGTTIAVGGAIAAGGVSKLAPHDSHVWIWILGIAVVLAAIDIIAFVIKRQQASTLAVNAAANIATVNSEPKPLLTVAPVAPAALPPVSPKP